MKDYFIRLFKYDDFANRLMLDTFIKNNGDEKTGKLMIHILAAQQIWLNRCKGLPPAINTTQPDWPFDTVDNLITENSKAWLNYLDGLHANDFEKPIKYKNLRGDDFEDRLADILAHVINHGTHHRAQIGQQLKAAGAALPTTDYIAYLRQLNN